jgi:hypothetical protein
MTNLCRGNCRAHNVDSHLSTKFSPYTSYKSDPQPFGQIHCWLFFINSNSSDKNVKIIRSKSQTPPLICLNANKNIIIFRKIQGVAYVKL